jgi:hypothetical protein
LSAKAELPPDNRVTQGPFGGIVDWLDESLAMPTEFTQAVLEVQQVPAHRRRLPVRVRRSLVQRQVDLAIWSADVLRKYRPVDRSVSEAIPTVKSYIFARWPVTQLLRLNLHWIDHYSGSKVVSNKETEREYIFLFFEKYVRGTASLRLSTRISFCIT